MKRYVAAEGELAVSIEDEAWLSIIEQCSAAGRRETGGILIGRYTRWRDQAHIIEATGPPRDSRFWAFAFWRGLKGLRTLLAARWRESGMSYLGEWHFHPYMSAEPSPTDLKQMRQFAGDPAYQCPKPVLVVVGGDPAQDEDVTVSVVDGDAVVPFEPASESQVRSDAVGAPPAAVS
ncbi:MAG TPA: Mov34/MPN/PAD-1 family protein [Candidatus Limnocylindrales bacterium]